MNPQSPPPPKDLIEFPSALQSPLEASRGRSRRFNIFNNSFKIYLKLGFFRLGILKLGIFKLRYL